MFGVGNEKFDACPRLRHAYPKRLAERYKHMVSHVSNPWNNAVTFLEMRYGAQSLATGSGFFWALEDRTFLVSNWHNFSGRDPGSGRPISEHGGVPDRMLFTAFKRTSEPDDKGYFAIEVRATEVPLYDHDLHGPRWNEHPTFRRAVDIGAIEITELLARDGLDYRHANMLEGDAATEPQASQDVFILGFPLGIVTGIPIPVWKRGTVATDPSFDPDGLPKIYVDAATRKGMSGSVVLVRHILVGNYPRKDGSTASVLYAQKDQILGVYSGRLHPDNVQAQLGIVWKRTVIDETVFAQVPASL
jgi:hypothetical protein